MVHIIRDRRLLPTFVALAVTAFLVIPMITNARVVNAQSNEDENSCEDVPESDFVDRLKAAAAHRQSIDCADFYDITAGAREDEEGRYYEPLRNVRRGQMASFIINSLEAAGLDGRLPDGDPPDEFGDISGSAHRGSINRLARIGVVRGTDGNNYDPEEFVGRDQMASFILQAYEWAYQQNYETSNSYFGDVRPNNPHFGNINAAYEEELVRGTEEPDEGQPNSGRYDPNPDVLRQAMASFLTNLLTQLQGAPQEFCEPSSSPSPSSTASPRPTSSASPTATASPTSGGGLLPIGGGGGGGGSPTPSASASASASPRPSASASASASASPTATSSPCAEQSGSPSPSPTGTASPRPTGTASPTSSSSPTATASPSESECPLIICP